MNTSFGKACGAVFVIGSILWAAGSCTAATKEFRLDNGLRVMLRPVVGTSEVAVLVLYDLGELHDPPGKSGLGHLVEHIYVTAATPMVPQRTVNEFAKDYSKKVSGQVVFQWNAQTGDDSTVLAGVVPADRLDKEINQAAERMGQLQIEPSDLDREVPRMLQEVRNMFEGFPPLVARNHVRERLHPRPNGGRHGGVPEQIKRLTLDDVGQHWRNYCKAGNARLVIAGNIDPKAVEAQVRQAFAVIPAGRPVPPKPDDLPPSFGRVSIPVAQASKGSWVCLGYRSPPPDSQLFPAFLALVARLQADAMRLTSDPQAFPVIFAPLDDFGTLYLISKTTKAETADQVVQRLSKLVREATAAKAPEIGGLNSKTQFAILLGTMPIPDPVLCNNLYGAAFVSARQRQLGIQGESLADALDHLSQECLDRCVKEYLSEDKRVVVVAGT